MGQREPIRSDQKQMGSTGVNGGQRWPTGVTAGTRQGSVRRGLYGSEHRPLNIRRSMVFNRYSEVYGQRENESYQRKSIQKRSEVAKSQSKFNIVHRTMNRDLKGQGVLP